MSFNSRLMLGMRKEHLFVLALVLLIPFGLFELLAGSGSFDDIKSSAARSRMLLARSSHSQIAQFAGHQFDYLDWLSKHGTEAEYAALTKVSVYLTEKILPLRSLSELSPLESVRVTFNGGLLRVTFLLLASMRLAILAMLIAFVEGAKSAKAYEAPNLLGLTGNNRLFYSGARLRLFIKAKKNARVSSASVHIPTALCLETLDLNQIKSLSLYRLLLDSGAVTPTNVHLVGFVARYAEWAPSVPSDDEQRLFVESLRQDVRLYDYTYASLAALLSLRTRYEAKNVLGAIAAEDVSFPLSAANYGKVFISACHRCLSLEARAALGMLPAAQLATVVLSIATSRILCYSKDDDDWIASSTPLHLNARAAFNSSPFIFEDFNISSARIIRRALSFAAPLERYTALPAHMIPSEWALRQMSELLIVAPHQLEQCADTLELFSLLREVEQRWTREFVDSALLLSAESGRSVFASRSNEIVIPMAQVLANLRRSVSRQQMDRMRELLFLRSSRNRLDTLDAQKNSELPEPPTEKEIQEAMTEHNLTERDVRDWSVLRAVVIYADWIPSHLEFLKRPINNLVFALVTSESGEVKALAGMVVLKGDALAKRWGPQWTARFSPLFRATYFTDSDSFRTAQKKVDRIRILPVDRVIQSRGSHE